MGRGKRTGAINATVFFEEEPNSTLVTETNQPPTFSQKQLDDLERIKESAIQLQNDYAERLRLMRAQRREAEYKAFKDEQATQLEAIDAHLESVRAKYAKTASSSASGPESTSVPSSVPKPSESNAGAPVSTSSAVSSAVVDAMEGISELEQATIAHRLKTSQLKLKAIGTKEKLDKLEAIYEGLPHLTEEEARTALLLLGEDEFDVLEEYARYPEFRELRHSIARKHMEEAKKVKPKVKRTAASAKAKIPGSTDASSSSAPKSSKQGARYTASGTLNTSTTSLNSRGSTPLETSLIASSGTLPNGNHVGSMNPGDDAIAALLPEGTDLNYLPTPLEHSSRGTSQHEDDDSENGGDEVYELDGEDYATRTHKKKKQVTVKKLRLDDAIAQGSMEGWSAARVRAWNLRHENPNAYYYRFNQPGEEQRNGKWTESERERFFARMNEVGVNGQWGIFAKEIYGRVGYQCANFYRQMIENNEIEDPRYVIDESGKAHFLFSKRKKKSTNSKSSANDDNDESDMGSTEGMTKVTRDGKDIYIPKINVPARKNASRAASAPSSSTVAGTDISENGAFTTLKGAQSGSNVAQQGEKGASKGSRGASTIPHQVGGTVSGLLGSEAVDDLEASSSVRKRSKSVSETRDKKKNAKKRKRGGDVDDDADYRPSSTWSREKAEREASARLKDRMEANPLPGFKDVITNAELIQPALSPYGHVLSYATWVKCLMTDPKNTCPFTKQPLKKRDLIILTWENIDVYRDRIDRSGQ